MIRDDPSRSELIRLGLAVRVDPVRLLYLPHKINEETERHESMPQMMQILQRVEAVQCNSAPKTTAVLC